LHDAGESVLYCVGWPPPMLMFEYSHYVYLQVAILMIDVLCIISIELFCWLTKILFFLFFIFEGECVRVSLRLLLWTCRWLLVTVWLSFLAVSFSGLGVVV
jgi:hypothetical protein